MIQSRWDWPGGKNVRQIFKIYPANVPMRVKVSNSNPRRFRPIPMRYEAAPIRTFVAQIDAK